MTTIFIPAAAGLLLFMLCYLLRDNRKTHNIPCCSRKGPGLSLLLAVSLAVRLVAAGFSGGFDTDMSCFAAWSERIFSLGPSGFYSDTVFTDYPPGYLYILYLIGALRSLLGIVYGSAAHFILLKLPSILSDLLCGGLLYREASRRFPGRNAFLLCAAYLLNPAVILNSAVWGQIDSLYTLFILLICLCLVRGRTVPAYFLFCTGILIKPQLLFVAPVLFLGVLEHVFLRKFSLHRLFYNLGGGLLALSAALLLILPFGGETVFRQYFSTIASYPYAAVNAYNLWGLLGFNWVSQETRLFGIPCRVTGAFLIVLACFLLLFFGLRRRDTGEKYPLLAAWFLTAVFTCSVRMHERYLYPALLLLLFAALFNSDKKLLLSYCGFSLLHYCNTAHVLFFYDPYDYDRRNPFLLLVSAGTVVLFLFLTQLVFRRFSVRSDAAEGPGKNAAGFPRLLLNPLPPRPSCRPEKLTKADVLCMTGITLLYALFALYDLGDHKAPENALQMSAGEEITLSFDLAWEQRITSLAYYIAPEHNRRFLLSCSAGGSVGLTLEKVFTWQTVDLSVTGNELTLTLESPAASLLELVFLDSSGMPVSPANAADYPALFDEASLYPGVSTFRNSMYFDEIYHGRTAYEFLHGLISYENTHPPLGKILIAVGILLFGMNPFGWRIIGAVTGILMVPVLYLFAKRMTKKTSLAALAAVLFAFDFMHFTQTRLATIDVFITFFVLLMYFFLYGYSCLSFYDTALKRTLLPLGLCGICMGLGIACKWTGIYAGLGLAVLFFGVLYRRYREYLYAKADPDGCTQGISHRTIRNVFLPNTLKTLLFCLVFFIAIPVLIYLLSYLPFSDGSGDGLFLRMLHNLQTMFRYHSSLDATHPYSSTWYQWPVMQRPIWYYSRIVTGSAGNGGLREGISAFGNPLVWWAGIPAALHAFTLCIRKKDRTAAFLLIGYLAQYLPWFFVTRVTFIYHYFPSVAFVVLMILNSLRHLETRMKKTHFDLLLIGYGISASVLFLLFYPVLSGQPVEADFVAHFLRWFDSWVLCAT